MLGLVGRKAGMTRVFTETGESIPVTVIEAAPNAITQIKTTDTDGYAAVQVNFGEQKPGRVSKALRGHYAKAEVEPGRKLHEFRLSQNPDLFTPAASEPAAPADDAAESTEEQTASTEEANSNDNQIYLGGQLTVTQFTAGQKVDVTGTSIGKGFAGTVKRHNFHMQDATHGNSLSHRAPGSIGQCQTPGRVFKGKKMAGQMGNVRRTMQNLEVVKIDTEHNVVLVKGAVPGHAGGTVVIQPAVKSATKK